LPAKVLVVPVGVVSVMKFHCILPFGTLLFIICSVATTKRRRLS